MSHTYTDITNSKFKVVDGEFKMVCEYASGLMTIKITKLSNYTTWSHNSAIPDIAMNDDARLRISYSTFNQFEILRNISRGLASDIFKVILPTTFLLDNRKRLTIYITTKLLDMTTECKIYCSLCVDDDISGKANKIMKRQRKNVEAKIQLLNRELTLLQVAEGSLQK